jgi:predicted ester cyclase
MSEQDNIRVVEEIFEHLNRHDLSQVDSYETTDYQADAPGSPGAQNREAARAYVQGFIDAFPDLHFELTHKIAQGDFVVVNWVGSGTHTGPLRTPTGDMLPATGKKARVPGSTTYQFRDNLASRSWQYWDMVTLLAQLGLMPG